ncbi:hypothetical protein, partial [Pseudoflavonifractor capillosus]
MTELQGRMEARGILAGGARAPGALTGRLGGSDGAVPYKIGAGLKVVEGELMVDTANAVEQDNTRPVTSAAVYVEIGNIEALLAA